MLMKSSESRICYILRKCNYVTVVPS